MPARPPILHATETAPRLYSRSLTSGHRHELLTSFGGPPQGHLVRGLEGGAQSLRGEARLLSTPPIRDRVAPVSGLRWFRLGKVPTFGPR